MGIEKWDSFLDSVEKPVNLVVDIVNGKRISAMNTPSS